MDRDQLNKVTVRLERMRLARARLGLDNGESKKGLTPLQEDLEFFLKHQYPTNKRFE
jgi:hypothetical protein